MKLQTSNCILVLAMLCAAGTTMATNNIWRWDDLTRLQDRVDGRYEYLTSNSGGSAVGITEYDSFGTPRTWVSIVAERRHANCDSIMAYEYTDMWYDGSWFWVPEVHRSQESDFPWATVGFIDDHPLNAQVAINSQQKMWYGVFRPPMAPYQRDSVRTYASSNLTPVTEEVGSAWRRLQLEDENNTDSLTAGASMSLG